MQATTPTPTASTATLANWQLVSWVVAGLCAGLAVCLSISQIRGHMRNWSSPKQQRKIISILWIVPVSGLLLLYISSIVKVEAMVLFTHLVSFTPSHRCRSIPSTVGCRSATYMPPSTSMHFETVTKPTSFTCFCPSCTLT